MAERKNRHESNSVELDPEECTYTLEPAKVEVGSGYALSINYDENDKPVIDIKTYGKVDLEKIHIEIAKLYPHARIRRLAQTPQVTIAKKERRTRKK